MSFTVIGTYSFACDHPDCPEVAECIPRDGRRLLDEAHRLIRLQGWVVPGENTKRRHYCPAHTPKGVSLKKQLARHKKREILTAVTFMDHVEVTDGCWLWKELRNNDGYPTWGRRLAHRLSFELYVGPIPADFTVDHRCFNPPCVRPDHLSAVSRPVNEKRRREFGRAACPECRRVISGRYLGGLDARSEGKLKLVRHKNPDGVNWCSGAQSIAQAEE